jgi:hypothetical protein
MAIEGVEGVRGGAALVAPGPGGDRVCEACGVRGLSSTLRSSGFGLAGGAMAMKPLESATIEQVIEGEKASGAIGSESDETYVDLSEGIFHRRGKGIRLPAPGCLAHLSRATATHEPNKHVGERERAYDTQPFGREEVPSVSEQGFSP